MDEQKYDSRQETELHIEMVRMYMNTVMMELKQRADLHDLSKLLPPEKEAFDRLTPRLKDLEYGSDEYHQSLSELKVALEHHYKHNSHHPQHYEDGLYGFDLFDLVEMFCDWMAATARTKDGTMEKSLEINRVRFGMSEQLVAIFKNTYDRHFRIVSR